MQNNRIVQNLSQAKQQGRKCLMPYITAGYPDLETTAGLLKRFDAAGCQAIEIGFPFSDSVADGPVIQESFYKALDNGFRVENLFNTVREVRDSISCGLLAMVSMSIVRRIGLDAFTTQAAEAGFDGLIVPDVPMDECGDLAAAAQRSNLCNVLMAAPTTTTDRRHEIAAASSGFVYLIAAKGITGERSGLSQDLGDNVRRMQEEGDLPVMVGFGIGDVDQVREVCKLADGVIVGSAVIRRITTCVENEQTVEQTVDTLGQYIDELMEGTK